MSIPKEVIDQFVKAAKSNGSKKEPNMLYGTIVESGGSNYVKLDGSGILTPFTTTVNTKVGERVIVNISNHSAIVMGNTSSPAARTEDVEEAGKTAANYLGFNDLGLIVGDMRNSQLGKNVLVAADEIDIRDGDKILASFAEALIELGKNNPKAVISLCNGLGKILFDQDDEDYEGIMRILSKWISIEAEKYAFIQSGSDTDYSRVSTDADEGSYNVDIEARNVSGNKITEISAHSSEGSSAYIRNFVRDGNKLNKFTMFSDVASITSPLEINGFRYGDNQQILWSGAYYMSSSHTVSLSNLVSAMPNGIVLVFSGYVDGSATDYGFSCHFIPRREVIAHPGRGHSFILSNNGASIFGTKYLYISDNQIKGHDTNVTENVTVASGIKTNNKYFVLRHVIGV